jgi:ubiquinone/menaquinone biosynthesis C-methylase UbiE
MDAAEYRLMFELENAHWWFQGKHTIVERLITRFRDGEPARRVLDVGCGTGGMLQSLARDSEGNGVDVEPLALRLCQQRGLRHLTRATAERLPYGPNRFDVVTMLDVLYHRRVEDIEAALREACRVCRPGGLLVVTDCAFAWLRSRHDVAVHGARRFRRHELAGYVAKSGFRVLKASYMNTLLFPIAAAARLVDRARHGTASPASSVHADSPAINRALAAIYRLEAPLLDRLDLPFGLSIVVVGRKPAA